MVIMASGIARGRVRTTTTMESQYMAAILQITGWQREMQPLFTVYFFGIGPSCYDQLTPVKTRYLLTSITWPHHGLKLTAHRGHVFYFLSWPLTWCCFFDWIAGSCLVNLLKTRQDCTRALAITCLSHLGQNFVQRTTFKLLPSRKQVCRLSLKNRL